MSGSLDHFPADIIRQLLIDLGVGSEITAADWPAFSQKEPDSPDNAITVFDTMGRDLGRTNPDMVRSERYGIQVRVRGGDIDAAGVRARSVAMALDSVVRRPVVIDATLYLVLGFVRSGPVLRLGIDAPSSGRWIFVVNGLASLQKA
jgi:hypothetical protein